MSMLRFFRTRLLLPAIAPLLLLSSCFYKVENAVATQEFAHTPAPTAGLAVDGFVSAVAQLETHGYYRLKQDCLYSLDSSYCCDIPPSENFLSQSIAQANEFLRSYHSISGTARKEYTPIDNINLSGLLEIRRYLLQKQSDQGTNLSTIAIEEWILEDESSAERIVMQLDSLSDEAWHYVSKTPISHSRRKNKLRFIRTESYEMVAELPLINLMLAESW